MVYIFCFDSWSTNFRTSDVEIFWFCFKKIANRLYIEVKLKCDELYMQLYYEGMSQP